MQANNPMAGMKERCREEGAYRVHQNGNSMKHIVIIGNGVAGVTAARHIRKMADYRITIISAESDHFYSRTALMYIYMGHMTYENTKPYEDWFWEKNRMELVRGYVEEIDTDAGMLRMASGPAINYDILLIATGSKPNLFGWPGQELEGVQGLYGLADLESMERNTRGIERGVVVGGGLIGVEVAEMLHARNIPVAFLVREPTYMARILPAQEGEMIQRHLREHGIDLRLGTELREILADENGHARAVITSAGEEIPCQFVALTAGVSPNIDIVRNSKIETDRGVLVNDCFETNIPGIYAAGDCVEFRDAGSGRSRVEQLWYTGRKHGEIVARNICGARTLYDPGVWFNSAKFFDIEYQTYGAILPNPVEGVRTLYWERAAERRCVRIDYAMDDRRVLGFNLLGIRYRHAVCETWIREGRAIEDVLENLGAANFDPEFFPQFEREIVELFNAGHTGTPLKLRRGRGLFGNIFTSRRTA